MKIFTRTFLYTLSLLVSIALLANGLVYTLMPKVYTDQKQKRLTEQTERFIKQLETEQQEGIIDRIARYAVSLQANLAITLGSDAYSMLTWNGGVISQKEVPTSEECGEPVKNNAFEGNVRTVTVSVSEEHGVRIIEDGKSSVQTADTLSGLFSVEGAGSNTIRIQRNFTVEDKSGTLTAVVTLAPVEEAVQVIIALLPISLCLCIVIAVVFSLLYARAITHPIKAISDETQRMTTLAKDAKCKIQTKDEIGMLAANINNLYANLLGTIVSLEVELKKVSATERFKTDFLRAASHELKTPVTAVSVIMDNMILGIGKYKNHADWLPRCKKLIDRLSEMLHEILSASRFNEISETCITESIEVLCRKIIEPYTMVARAKGINLYVDWSAAFTVEIPPDLLGKALSNILSNAVQYTESGGRLSVYCRERSLFVENKCRPIPEEKLSQLFQPFYRIEEFHGAVSEGTGLGLYITHSILRFLGLDFSFKPMASPDGMRFTVNF